MDAGAEINHSVICCSLNLHCLIILMTNNTWLLYFCSRQSKTSPLMRGNYEFYIFVTQKAAYDYFKLVFIVMIWDFDFVYYYLLLLLLLLVVVVVVVVVVLVLFVWFTISSFTKVFAFQ